MHRDLTNLLIPITEFRPYQNVMEFFGTVNQIYDRLPDNIEQTNPDAYEAAQKANYAAYAAVEAVIDTHVALTAARALGLNVRLYSNLYGCLIQDGVQPEETETTEESAPSKEETAPPASALNPELIDNDRPYLDALDTLVNVLTGNSERNEWNENLIPKNPQLNAAIDQVSQAVQAFAQRGYATNAPQEPQRAG